MWTRDFNIELQAMDIPADFTRQLVFSQEAV